jgi:hypothetical protein
MAFDDGLRVTVAALSQMSFASGAVRTVQYSTLPGLTFSCNHGQSFHLILA